MMNSQLRTVAVGIYTPTQETFLCDPVFEDSWREGAANAVDAPPVLPKPKRVYVNYVAELEELIDGRDDEEFNRRGC
jgi:hypothetical protein